jgi:hypothetical protein
LIANKFNLAVSPSTPFLQWLHLVEQQEHEQQHEQQDQQLEQQEQQREQQLEQQGQ